MSRERELAAAASKVLMALIQGRLPLQTRARTYRTSTMLSRSTASMRCRGQQDRKERGTGGDEGARRREKREMEKKCLKEQQLEITNFEKTLKKTLTPTSSSSPLTALSRALPLSLPLPCPPPMPPLSPSRLRTINLIEALKEERAGRGGGDEEGEDAPEEAVEW